MKGYLAAVLCATLLMGGGCSKSDKPKGLLNKDQMVGALTELYLAEQKVATVAVSRDSTSKIFTQMSPAIFAKIGASDSVFHRSFDYYLDRPAEMEQIYNAVIDTLNLREQRMISNEVKK